MKNLFFIMFIIIIFFKTGNVLSNNNIFNVNNVEINKESYKNTQNLANLAFKKAFLKLLDRVLLEEDYKKISETNLLQIKELISYYQIITPEEDENTKFIKVNVFFDQNKMHNFFFRRNILYSDILNTEIVILPIIIDKDKYFIYSQNYFYKNWNQESLNNLIEYILPLEDIENIKKIINNKDDLYKINISDILKDYNNNNLAFIVIEKKENFAKIFLNTKISDQKLIKSLSIDQDNFQEEEFNNKIILEIKKEIKNLVKSQNLIDVRTPSFLNVEINLENKNNLFEFQKKIENIDLINNFYIQQLNKDFAIVKIKYLGKINKIIKKLKDQNIDLKMVEGQWRIKIS
jgi:hypothetical protein